MIQCISMNPISQGGGSFDGMHNVLLFSPGLTLDFNIYFQVGIILLNSKVKNTALEGVNSAGQPFSKHYDI